MFIIDEGAYFTVVTSLPLTDESKAVLVESLSGEIQFASLLAMNARRLRVAASTRMARLA